MSADVLWHRSLGLCGACLKTDATSESVLSIWPAAWLKAQASLHPASIESKQFLLGHPNDEPAKGLESYALGTFQLTPRSADFWLEIQYWMVCWVLHFEYRSDNQIFSPLLCSELAIDLPLFEYRDPHERHAHFFYHALWWWREAIQLNQARHWKPPPMVQAVFLFQWVYLSLLLSLNLP